MITKVAIYARVSSEQQLEGFSIEAQLRVMREYAQAQGWTIFREYVDEGYSASTGKRPQFQIFLRDAKLRLFEGVLVHKLDRLYRNLAQLLETVEALEKQGITLISVTERVDFSSPSGKMLLTNLGMISEFYLNNLKEETVKGKHQRALAGLWNGDIPYGYCRGLCSRCDDPNGKGYCPAYGQADRGDGRNLIARPKDSEGLQWAFQLHAGGRSDQDVATSLNEKGYRTNMKFTKRAEPLRPGGPKPFCKDTVRTMLQNPVYLGFVSYKGQLVRGNQPALISRELFDASQKARERLRCSRNTPRKRTRFYLFSGLIRCAECGFVMRGRAYRARQGEVRHYVDTGHEHEMKCEQGWVVAEEIEPQIERYLSKIRLPEAWMARILQLTQTDAKSQLNERQRLLLQSRLQRLMKLYVAGNLGEAEFEREKAKIERELTRLQPAKNSIPNLPSSLEDFLTLWKSASENERYQILRRLFRAIYVRGDRIERVEVRKPFKVLFKGRV
jgi:site-specific DNA recombinase